MVASNPDKASPHTTRQMLDDLDALMERMLSVPVADAEPAAAPPASPKLSATLTLLEPPAPKPIPVRRPLETPVKLETPAVAPPPAFPKQTPPAPTAHDMGQSLPVVARKDFNEEPGRVPTSEARQDAASVAVLEPITNDVLPPSMLPRITQLLAEVPDAKPSALGMLYAPLWWINVAFDGCTYLLGRPGAFLRDAGGRLIVGLLGIVLGLLAVAWYAKDAWGWTW
jgi:hypothetical protein